MGRPIPKHVIALEEENPGRRLCYQCGSLKNPDQFYGHDGGIRKGRECRTCRSTRWENLDDKQRAQQLIALAKDRARKKGVPFSLTIDDLDIPSRCPVLGIPIKFSKMKDRHSSPSIDRLSSELGYVPGNIIIVSWLANDIRRNFNPDQIIAVGQFYKTLLQSIQ